MINIQKPLTKRLKILSISPTLIMSVLRPPDCDVLQYLKLPIPKDCRTIGLNANWASSQFEIMLEHESFDPVLEGDIPPYISHYEAEWVAFGKIKNEIQDDLPVYKEIK